MHHNAHKSFVISSLAKEQSQVMLKKQQSQWHEPFENGMSSAQICIEDNGVEQNPTPINTQEISTAKSIDDNEQPSIADDVMNVCKVIMRNRSTNIRIE
jgi:hypothetical protein